MRRFPDSVKRLFWDVDPVTLDLDASSHYVMGRVMARGSWEAMKWLRARYSQLDLRTFVEHHGRKQLAPRELAYWALITEARVEIPTGGGRPTWAG